MNSRAKRRAWSGSRDAAALDAASSPSPPAPALSNASGILRFEPQEADAGGRLDRYLGLAAEARRIALSRTRLRALIESGRVSVDSALTLDPSQPVRAGTVINVDTPPTAAPKPIGEAIPLAIVFEDAHLLVLDKPAGLVVHPAPGHADGTLVNALIAHCGDSLSGIGGVRRPGIVHRLDKDTSGLLVVAKTDAAHHGLSDLFADHGRSGSLSREYRAVVWGAPDRSAGTVDAPIGRRPRRPTRMAVVGDGHGREAITHWRVEEALGEATLIRCRLETGRTHQIRVHLAHIGHPLLGDSTYGSGFKSKAATLDADARSALSDLGRQALHAAHLGFEHPITGQPLAFDSPLPADFVLLIRSLRGN